MKTFNIIVSFPQKSQLHQTNLTLDQLKRKARRFIVQNDLSKIVNSDRAVTENVVTESLSKLKKYTAAFWYGDQKCRITFEDATDSNQNQEHQNAAKFSSQFESIEQLAKLISTKKPFQLPLPCELSIHNFTLKHDDLIDNPWLADSDTDNDKIDDKQAIQALKGAPLTDQKQKEEYKSLHEEVQKRLSKYQYKAKQEFKHNKPSTEPLDETSLAIISLLWQPRHYMDNITFKTQSDREAFMNVYALADQCSVTNLGNVTRFGTLKKINNIHELVQKHSLQPYLKDADNSNIIEKVAVLAKLHKELLSNHYQCTYKAIAVLDRYITLFNQSGSPTKEAFELTKLLQTILDLSEEHSYDLQRSSTITQLKQAQEFSKKALTALKKTNDIIDLKITSRPLRQFLLDVAFWLLMTVLVVPILFCAIYGINYRMRKGQSWHYWKAGKSEHPAYLEKNLKGLFKMQFFKLSGSDKKNDFISAAYKSSPLPKEEKTAAVKS